MPIKAHGPRMLRKPQHSVLVKPPHFYETLLRARLNGVMRSPIAAKKSVDVPGLGTVVIKKSKASPGGRAQTVITVDGKAVDSVKFYRELISGRLNIKTEI